VNIIVSDCNGHYHFRPDNTLAKGSGEYYLPPSIEHIETIPAAVIRIDRAAKGLSRRFAHRYISQYSYGLLIYPATSSLQATLRTTLDNTTYICDNFFPIEEVIQEESIMSFIIDSRLSRYKIPHSALLKENAYELMEIITIHSSLKTGDLLFLELEPEVEEQTIQARQGSYISLSTEKGQIISVTIR